VDPSMIRRLLLAQHNGLRVLIRTIEALLEEAPPGAAMQEALVRLHDAVSAHNQDEEALLAPLLPTTDAWGPLRLDGMIAHHADEHAALLAHLEAARSTPTAQLAGIAARAISELRAHMREEEREFLSARVLRDDVLTLDPDGS
jgi:hypothetical protein